MTPIDANATSWVRAYYPAFDGFRGLAILLVFVRHYGFLVLPWAWIYSLWVGVDLFFVLSGFLITGILFDSLGDPHFFRNFYLRRSLRIFPLYYATFLVLVLGALVIHPHAIPHSILLYAAYIGNLFVPFFDLGKHNPTVVTFTILHIPWKISIGFFWSLCVEEQFYLVWPLAVYLVRSRTKLMVLAGCGILGTSLLRSFLYFYLSPEALSQGALFNLTYTRCDTLLIGAWCALWLRGVRLTRSQLKSLCYRVGFASVTVIAVGVSLTLTRWPSKLTNPFWGTIGYTVLGVAGAAMLLRSLDETSWIHRRLRFRGLAALGTISYGFYLFHDLPQEMVARFLAHHHFRYHLDLVLIVLLFCVTYLLAWLSFRYLESPFLRLKKWLAPGHRSVPSGDEESLLPVA